MLKLKRLSSTTVLFIFIPVLVAVIIFFKLSYSNERTVYAKIKVAQGLWWAATKEPSISLENSIKTGDHEVGLLGKQIAEIESVRIYEVAGTQDEDRVNIFFVAKLKANFDKTENKYSFKRSNLLVGSPIEIETQRSLITGTVLELSENPIEANLQEKQVTLIKENAYPWEYNAIKTGDTYSNREEVVFEVLNKKILGDSTFYRGDLFSNISPSTVYPTLRISVTAKVKVSEKSGNLMWAEEKIIKTGSPIVVSTSKFDFQGFYISAVNDLPTH